MQSGEAPIMKLLIIEDEEMLLNEIKQSLTESGYRCETASNFSEGFERLGQFHYNAVIVDITIPGGSGLSLIKNFKNRIGETAILIISAKDSIRDKITGFGLGADDYITKPFHMEELHARIFALLRRKSFDGANILTFGELTVDVVERSLRIHKIKITLTKKEYDLLLYLVINKNRVVSYESIAEHLWGDGYDPSENYATVHVHTNNLRKKISEHSKTEYIKTFHGSGYKWLNA